MSIPSLTACKFGHIGTTLAFQITLGVALLASFARGQSQTAPDSAALQGTVRDSSGHPVAAASVSLQMKGTEILSVLTDAAGQYRFSGLHEGIYALRGKRAGDGEASVNGIALEKQKIRNVDLILGSSDSLRTKDSSTGAPEFYDKPSFTVAGVTDPSNLGGHGSDTIVRTKESLAKATASLGREASHSSQPDSSVSQTERSLREAVERDPGNFDVHYRLGKFLLDGGRHGEALPYLQQAARLNSGSYDTAYELALAYAAAGEYENARTNLHALLARQENADLHHLLGDLEEKAGNPLQSVREYERATELNPSEGYIFDWGAELLIHRAPEPSIEVFTKGNRLFPRSVRMLVGLGAAEYARGFYEQAVQNLCAASDLSPDDPVPYRFMGKIQNVDGPQADALSERLERFARLQPDNPEANYYYALSLWRQRKGPQDAGNKAQVEALLQKTVHLDPKFSMAHLQLGILYAEQRDFQHAISSYRRAIATNERLEEAHYRLSQAYRQTGETEKAQAEIHLYEQIAKENVGETERERSEIKQFVYTLRYQSGTLPRK